MNDAAEFYEAVAIRALIESDPRLTDRVGIGSAIVPGHETEADPPMLTAPYAVMFGDQDTEEPEHLTGSGEWSRTPAFIVHGVGDSELAAIATLGWIDAKLRPQGVGVCPVVPGRRTGPIRRIERPGNARDDAATPPVWTAIAVYAFTSNRIT